MGAAQFGVFPIIVAGTIVGCLYVDRLTRDTPPDRVALEYLKSISHVVVRAIEARRRAAVQHTSSKRHAALTATSRTTLADSAD